METQNNDLFTSEMMHNSKLSITNPDLENIIMAKIRKESLRKTRIHNIVLFSTIFIAIDAVLFTFIKLMDMKILNIGSNLTAFGEKAENAIGKIDAPVAGFQIWIYVFVVVSLLAIIIKLLTEENKPSKEMGK